MYHTSLNQTHKYLLLPGTAKSTFEGQLLTIINSWGYNIITFDDHFNILIISCADDIADKILELKCVEAKIESFTEIKNFQL